MMGPDFASKIPLGRWFLVILFCAGIGLVTAAAVLLHVILSIAGIL